MPSPEGPGADGAPIAEDRWEVGAPRSSPDSASPPAASGSRLTIRTPAKINLGLRVLGRRPDGYHRIRTRLAAVALWDTLTLEPGGRGFRLVVEGPEAAGIPAGGENLVLRAAERIEQARRLRAAPREPRPGVLFRLRKEIPAGRGLGGGSSDAAAALIGLNRLFRLDLPRSVLHRMAAAIGMDTPFFLYGGSAFAAGRGDAVLPLVEPPGDTGPGLPLVLLLPGYGVPTADAYRGLPAPLSGENEPSGGAAPVGRIAAPSGGFGGRAEPAGRRSFPPSLNDLRNDLEQSAVLRESSAAPSVPEMRRALAAAGALLTAMSGSGSAVFGVFADPAAAERAARSLDRGNCRALATRTVSRREQCAARSGLSP